LHEELAVVGEVAREVEDEAELRELGGLEPHGPERNREEGAVLRMADAGHPRSEQEQHAGERQHVPVFPQHAVVLAQREDRAGIGDEPDHEPRGLVAREALVDPVELDQPEAGEHRDEWQQVRVGIGQRDRRDDVRDHDEPEESGAVEEGDVREVARVVREHRREPDGDEQRRRDQESEVTDAPKDHRSSSRSTALMRLCASWPDRIW
jgi:hypothetical protein